MGGCGAARNRDSAPDGIPDLPAGSDCPVSACDIPKHAEHQKHCLFRYCRRIHSFAVADIYMPSSCSFNIDPVIGNAFGMDQAKVRHSLYQFAWYVPDRICDNKLRIACGFQVFRCRKPDRGFHSLKPEQKTVRISKALNIPGFSDMKQFHYEFSSAWSFPVFPPPAPPDNVQCRYTLAASFASRAFFAASV